MSKKDIRPSPTFCTVTENWAGPENEARVPSTSVAVNCMFLFTAGASQIIIGTKSLLLFVSLIPRLQIVMGMEIDLFLSCVSVFCTTSSLLYLL